MHQVENSNEGMAFGSMTLLLISLLGMSVGVVRDFLIVAVFIVTGLLFSLWLWFRNRFRQENTNRSISRTFKEQDERISSLEKTGQETELLLHRQNKSMTAISRRARRFARQEGLSAEEARQRRELSEELDALAQSGGAAISGYARRNRKPAATYVPLLDEALRELSERAAEQGVDLQVAVSGSASNLCAAANEEDVAALVSALIENALEAVAAGGQKYIAVHIWAEAAPYRMDVQDAGAASGADALTETVSRLCQKHGISLEWADFPGNIAFSRWFSLCFDGLGETRMP